MMILSFELSTRKVSLALLKDNGVLAEDCWEETPPRREAVFDRVSHVVEQAGTSLDAVNLYVAGRGPGAYSGMRVAIAAARGLAMPDNTPVHAVSSGEALAWSVMSGHEGPVAVVGDARRDMVWAGVFEGNERAIEQTVDWKLFPIQDVCGVFPGDVVAVTSDWDRLKDRISSSSLAKVHWIEDNIHPAAADVGRLAGSRRAEGRPSEPLIPLYLHPPVFAPPVTT